jgi:hypothetical protein
MLKLIGITKEHEVDVESNDEAYALIQKSVRKYRAREIEQLMLENGFSGSIIHSPESWRKTEMGRSLARHLLLNYSKQTQCHDLPPTLLPKLDDERPLAGIKVVELARIIAGTAAGAALASMGAEIIRVNSSKLKDYTPAQPSSLMAGKITIDLDLDDPADQARLMSLFEEADVILQGYRLRSLERRGFGLNAALSLANKRGRGIIYVDENCYGPDGCYAERPGWQQVADAAAGNSWIMAQSFGFPPGQGVLPSLPISDMSTGLCAALTIMLAIRDRSISGGSYHGHVALTGYDMASIDGEIRLYEPAIVQKIQDKYQFAPWSSDAHVAPLYYEILKAWERNRDHMQNEDFFVHFSNSSFGRDLRVLAPIIRYAEKEMSPRWTSPPVPFCHHKFRHFSRD